MTHAILGRWGKNLAVRFPTEISTQLRLQEGENLEIEHGPDYVIIRRAKPRYTIDELFAGKSDAEWRSAYAGAFDWGPDLGREIVEE